MTDAILITYLNDFIFCPISIYFHNLYGDTERMLYQSEYQLNGTKAHESVDERRNTSSNTISSLEVYSEKYNLIGKIDIYNYEKKCLSERKKKIKTVYDGYIFQLYAQLICMREMGYEISCIELYSMDDNKKYHIPLPEENPELFSKFEKVISDIQNFQMDEFVQDNPLKCENCIYESACDRSLKVCP